MTGDPATDDPPNGLAKENFARLQRLFESCSRWCKSRAREEYQLFKENYQRRNKLIRNHVYHLIATSFVMIVLLAFPASLALCGVWIGNYVSASWGVPIGIHALFFGFTGMIAVGIVYVGRFGLWVRRKIIAYWRTRTLPFPLEENENRPLSAREIDEISEADLNRAREYNFGHLVYAFLVHFIGLWGLFLLSELIPGFEDRAALNIVRIVTQAFAVLLGGLPALVGLLIATPNAPVLGTLGDSSLLLLTTAAVLPSLILAITARNVSYRVEVAFHQWWRTTSFLPKLLPVGYLLWVVLYGLAQAFPWLLPL